MEKSKNFKEWGIGSISLLLSIFGAMFSFTAWNGKALGEHLLSAIGLSFPIGIISLILLFISLFIGYKYKKDLLAETGIVVSIIFIFLILTLPIINTLFLIFKS